MLTGSTGQNGFLPQEILDMHPNATYIRRQGEVDAYDNDELRAAIKATGKKQVIVAGIVTDVCTLEPSPSHPNTDTPPMFHHSSTS